MAWLIGSIYVLWRQRRWAWWMLAWPVITVIGVIAALAAPPKFEDERAEFEVIAHQLLDSPETTALWDVKIGRFEIGRAYASSAGDVFFTDERTTLFAVESGWAYSPEGGAPERPGRDGEFSTEHLDRPWYRYKLVRNFSAHWKRIRPTSSFHTV